MNPKKYFEVKKVSYDALWHASRHSASGKVIYDRLTESEALEISHNLFRK